MAPVAAVDRIPVVDSHQHFWNPELADYPWLTDERAAVRRPFGPDDLRPVLAANGVDRSIAVEARSSVDETRELLALAEANRMLAGVIGWVDLAAPDVGTALAELRYGRGGEFLVGIRHQAREEPDERWLTRPDVLDGLAALADAGLVYDLLVTPRELAAAFEAARQLDRLTFVVEHMGEPPVDDEDPRWATGMESLAALPNVHCKLSGLSVAGPDQLAPFVERLRAWFGEERLLFGSDWPVCLLRSSYEQVVATFTALTADASPEVRRSILGGNAVQVYSLPTLR
jgi:L-fuconolactonase